MDGLQGILTPEQRTLGLSLSEDDHCVYLKNGTDLVSVMPARTATFAEIQREAYQEEQHLKSGVEIVRG
jgi:hypothetical protein